MSAASVTWIVVDGDEVVYRCHNRWEAIGYAACYQEHVGDRPILATVEDDDAKREGGAE